MTSELDKSPDRPEGAPEAAGGDLVAKWLANPQCEHDAATLADALELWWLNPKPNAADLIADCIFCLRHSKQRAEAAEAEGARYRMGLEDISMHPCLCAPEIEIDSEERMCASCIALTALGRYEDTRQALENSNG